VARKRSRKTGSAASAFATIAFVNRPGIVKVREAPLVVARRRLVVRRSNARWRELFELADVMSEGSARDEAQGRMWYGSTSLILPTPALDGGDVVFLVCLAEHDVHLRLRALRTARREASVRAPSPLGRLVGEIRVTGDKRGVRIDVDVQAPLIEPAGIARRAP
jgi:hypothetical protein